MIFSEGADIYSQKRKIHDVESNAFRFIEDSFLTFF